MMFGFACDETDEYMPMPIYLSHKLTDNLRWLRKKNVLDYLRPDGKAQVTVEYNEDGSVKRVDTIVVSTQHNETVTQKQLQDDIKEFCMSILIIIGDDLKCSKDTNTTNIYKSYRKICYWRPTGRQRTYRKKNNS